MNHRILVLMIFVLSFLISCGEDNPANSSKTPQISVILPDTAKVGDIVTISGINFGIVQDTSYITFNNVRAINITSWTDRVIKLRVPVGVTSGKVSVSVNSVKSNEVDFTVIEPDTSVPTPQIAVISPNSGKAGDTITISGNNFGIFQDTSYITFNTIKVIDIIIWSDKEIKFKVPEGAKSGKVSVTVNSIKSNEVDFTVIELNPFESVTIGTQIWMKRNLDVSTYRNGEIIRHAESNEDWTDAGKKKEGAWCYYNNDPALGAVYGKLYNWYAVNDPRGLAPEGWHVPSDTEWTVLSTYLGGENVAGGKMKETDTTHWNNPNIGATNSTSFTALPGGSRFTYGDFHNLRAFGNWMSATEYHEFDAWYIILFYPTTNIERRHCVKESGLSVRCVKD